MHMHKRYSPRVISSVYCEDIEDDETECRENRLEAKGMSIEVTY